MPELSGKYTGQFTSDTGTDLNLIVTWAAESNSNGTYTVSLQFFLESYTLDVGTRDDNTIKVKTTSGETTYYFHTDEVEIEGEDFTETYIGKASFDLTEAELISGAEITVDWMFRGSYSKKELETVEATGTIKAY